MIVCPACANAVTVPAAVETIIDRGGVRGRRVTCPVCRCIFSIVTRVLQFSPLLPEQLAKLRSQPRG